MAVRLQGNGPRLVSLALAALIAVEFARIAISLLGGGPVKSPQPVLSHRAARAQRPGLDVQGIVSAHLFGVATADPSAQDPANAPQSTANLVLAGTIATQDPRHGVAIISDGGPSKVYSVGDNVNGASLHSVYLDRVILDRGGAWETLPLPRLMGGHARAAGDPPAGRRRPAHGRGGGQYPPHGAAGPRPCSTRSCAPCPPTTMPPASCAAFAPIRAESADIQQAGLEAGRSGDGDHGTTLDDPQRSQKYSTPYRPPIT